MPTGPSAHITSAYTSTPGCPLSQEPIQHPRLISAPSVQKSVQIGTLRFERNRHERRTWPSRESPAIQPGISWSLEVTRWQMPCLMPGRKTGVSPGRTDHRAASAAPVDGRGEGADCRREFRRRREHIRDRAATRSGARAADGVACRGRLASKCQGSCR
jgi:hypothetical protein